MATTYTDRAFAGRLAAKISDLHRERLDVMQTIPSLDYGEYRQRFGFLEALRAVETLLQEIETDMNGDTREKA